MLLSVLDQSPISEGSTGVDALHNTIDLARLADELGYHRYWVAEHHGGPMLAGPEPRGADRPDRRGHGRDPGRERWRDAAPLQPAEGGRDVHGAGGAVPGADRPRDRPGGRYRPADHVRPPARPPPGRPGRLPPAAGRAARLLRRLAAAPITPSTGSRPRCRAAPSAPDPWLLGSSPQSAIWAAQLGLPYAFADFINAEGSDIARHYRERFRAQPRTPGRPNRRRSLGTHRRPPRTRPCSCRPAAAWRSRCCAGTS